MTPAAERATVPSPRPGAAATSTLLHRLTTRAAEHPAGSSDRALLLEAARAIEACTLPSAPVVAASDSPPSCVRLADQDADEIDFNRPATPPDPPSWIRF